MDVFGIEDFQSVSLDRMPDVSEKCSVQALFLKKLVHQVCDFEIVQIREWKVRIAANADFRQMHDADITTSAVHGIPE